MPLHRVQQCLYVRCVYLYFEKGLPWGTLYNFQNTCFDNGACEIIAVNKP